MGLGRAVTLLIPALPLIIALSSAGQGGLLLAADEPGGPFEPAVDDSLPVRLRLPDAGEAPRPDAGGPAPAESARARPDSAAAAQSDTARPPEVARPTRPWAGRGVPLAVPFQFFRPWTLREAAGSRGFRQAPLTLPTAPPSRAPFERRFAVDPERGVSLTTHAGASVSFAGYWAPLDEYRRTVGAESVRDAWNAKVVAALKAGDTAASRGLLDIDIPMPLPAPIVKAIGSGANLKVRGSERITFGGQSSYIVDALEQESGPPSKWPQLDMEQRLTVNLEGTIGDKIHVYVDHRSGGESFGGKANQIRVRYEGEEDEIVQGIELGEVNLSLPGTEFVSYSGSQEGLFGAKMTAKVGRLDLVAVASKEEGKSSAASFTGTSEADSIAINDVSYKARTFYAVDSDVLRYSNVALQSVKVYVDDRSGSNDIQTGAAPGRAYLEAPNGSTPPTGGPTQRGMFDQLVELEDYLVDYQTGILEFLSPVNENHVLAVSFSRLDGSAVGGSDGDSLRLLLLKKDDRVVGTAWDPIRRYELRNVYDLGAEDIPEEGFTLEIRKRTPSGEILDNQDGVPYTRILGLDTHGLGGDPTPDGIVDLEWIDFEKGYLIFPHFTPFCPGYDTTHFYYAPGGEPDPIYVADELDPKNCEVYAKEVFDADDDVYFVQVRYDRPRTTFYLGQMNIIENSEVVRLNGVALTRGVDYTIYYPAGQLTLLSEEAKQPDARISVDYDYQPFGIGGEKTLLGVRGVYNWSESIKLGTTWMYQGKGTPEDRPRLGEEPSRTVVGDVNLSATYTPDILTRIADAVPLVDTDAPSKVFVSAEAAMCIPEPNTKGFVSIDDMEGVENVDMLGVTRRLWTPASVPCEAGVVASDRMPINWYNPDRAVREGDLHPELSGQEADDIHTVLAVSYRDTTVGGGEWAGVMRLLSKTGNDYSHDEFLEMWVHDDGYREGKVLVDLGTLSEDFYPLDAPDGLLNSEDVDRNGFDASEDTGLDNVFGTDGQGVPGDDGDDDYEFTYGSDDYSRINGTERNERLDTEDLNGNYYLDTASKYWEIEVDLSDETYVVQDNSDTIPGNHWRLYRVPLDDAVPVNGMTDWVSVKAARLWFCDLRENGEPLMLGSLDIVGNQWEAEGVRDSTGAIVPETALGDMAFRVTSKNTKEDADYEPPFQVEVDEDTGIAEREQSLALLYENLPPGHSGAARKVYFSDDNYTGYESVQLFVHGSDDIAPGSVFFVRIGADSANYYEYSFEVIPGWRQRAGSASNSLIVPLKRLSDLKLPPYEDLDSVAVPGDTAAVLGETFARVGWPSFSRIRRLMLGVRNGSTDPADDDVSGEIWVDDVRLTDVRKDVGLAQRATLRVEMADLADLDLDVRFVDGDFHSLKQTRGSGQDNASYNLNGTVNADRFVSGLGIAAPVNVALKRSVARPTFSTGSDIVLDSDESDRERTESVERSVAVSLSRKRQSPDFWTHLLVDGLSLRASYSGSERLAPTKADTSSALRGRLAYRYSTERAGLRLFRDTQLYLKPTSVHFSADAELTRSLSYDIANDGAQTLRTNTRDRRLNAEAGVDFQFLDNLATSHTVSARRNLMLPNRPLANLNIGTEAERGYTNSLSFNPKFGSWLSPEYSFSSSYTDNHGAEARGTTDPYGVHDIRAQTNQQVSADFDLKKLVGTGAPRGDPPGRRGEEPARRREDADQGRPPDEGVFESEEGTGATAPPEDSGQAEGTPDAAQAGEAGGPELRRLLDPMLTLLRSMDAVEARYTLRWSSRFDNVAPEAVPGWKYRLGLSAGEGADDRSEEQSLDLGSGAKLTEDIRIKADYKRSVSGRWYRNAVAESLDLTTRTESMSESRKATLSWGGLERVGGLRSLCTTVRARSGVEFKKSYSGTYDAPTTKGDGFALSPVISLETTFKNGLTGNLSWERKRSRSYSLTGTGSVSEETTSGTSLSVKYRFSAPQGLKLPFFGQKLRFQSNLDCSLTLKTGSRLSRTALDEAGLAIASPTQSVKDFSLTGDATYSFSRNVSGGLQVSFSQSRDEKRDQTRRTIGVHLTAEFKF